MLMLVLLGMAALSLVVNAVSKVSAISGRASTTTSNLDKVRDALVDFVSLTGRLPCPANGATDTGLANPATANPVCGSPNGTVPWKTLGIPEEAAFDGWGRKISYRVYAGNTGITQADGASMVNCDSQKPGGAVVMAANGLCESTHSNLSDQFMTGKGLTFSDNGTASTKIAFMLISHGPTGYGAWLAGGNRMQLPNASNTSEYPNTGSGGTYYRVQSSNADVSPSDVNFFDDVVLALGIEDLAKRGGLAARDWPDQDIEITAATTTGMTTTSTDKFNATTASGGQTVTTTMTTDDSGASVVTLNFGSTGAYAYYSNCLWWPQPLITYNGTDKFGINMYLEFSTADGGRSSGNYDDLGGMVVGFLPWHTNSGDTSISTGLCGRADISTYMGWENNSGLGNLPGPRFGIEFDALQHSASQTNDPFRNHMSFVYSGIKHGESASSCSSSSSTYSGTTCYTGPWINWLRNGLASFHKLRIKVSPRDASCTAAPKMTVWLFPYSVCADSANTATCSAMANMSAEFSPGTLPTGAIELSGCMSTPVPADAFDKLFFGITLADRNASSGGAGSGMYLRNISFRSILVQ